MNAEEYRPSLDVMELMGELKQLLVAQRRADRLICRYLADLADGMVNFPPFVLIYADVFELAHARFGLSFRAIRERIRVGRALRALPLLDAALMSGELTYSRIREVTRVASVETERFWLEAARSLSMRALERRVGAASAEPDSPARATSSNMKPTNPLVDVPGEVLELLQQAMRMVRAASEHELTDAQALAAVARGAMAHFAGSASQQDSPGSSTHAPGSSTHAPGSSTHSGSPDSLARHAASAAPRSRARRGGLQAPDSDVPNAETRHSGEQAATDGRGDGWRSTHRASGAQPGSTTGLHWSEPLSEDARLLLDLIGTPGYWTVDTLHRTTSMPLPRVMCAAVDLMLRRLVTRGLLGVFELPATTLKRAG